MRKNSRIKDLMLLVCLVGIVAGVSHFVITNPLGPSRLLYYAQVPIIQWNTRCTDKAPEWMVKVQRFATSEMAAPASQLAFISMDGDISHCETGWKDRILGNQPLKSNARFRYASATKTVTAIAVLDLVNKGELSLDDKIVEVLGLEGELKDVRVADITIEHLLTHRGGWDRVRTQDVMFMMNHRPWCPLEPMKLNEVALMYAPGEMESYSNLGYCLLGLAIERVTGVPFREYIEGSFGKSGGSVQFVDGPYLADEVHYDFRHENFYMKNYHEAFDFQALSSSAGLSGNAIELAKYVKASLQRGPKIILEGGLDSKCNPEKIQKCYGYGVYRFQPKPDEPPVFMHGGKLPGSTSVIAINPEGDVLVWLGAGSPRPGSGALTEFYQLIHSMLTHY
ncbi:serine hydrolase domain-containing protein [Marinobacter shengliensis]|uniref:serine hydrolase domain-containing protein n=1 Tax=Marinobacter shengliensis TaxID=1389223 RepID=UPI0011082699|nr:serine hydrolase domain-containing protein [Marinobacter shengliensis]